MYLVQEDFLALYNMKLRELTNIYVQGWIRSRIRIRTSIKGFKARQSNKICTLDNFQSQWDREKFVTDKLVSEALALTLVKLK